MSNQHDALLGLELAARRLRVSACMVGQQSTVVEVNADAYRDLMAHMETATQVLAENNEKPPTAIGKVPHGRESMPCSCNGFCDRDGKITDNDRRAAGFACCIAAFVCRLCGKRYAGPVEDCHF